MEIHEQAGPKSHASGKTGPIRSDSRNPWFMLLLLTFAAITAAAVIFLRDDPVVDRLQTPFVFALIALAAYRLARIVAIDEVTQPFRIPFVEMRRRRGEWTEIARPEGLRGAIGALITSPESIGFWIAGIFVYLYVLIPDWLTLVLIVLAVNAVGELLNAVTHLLSARSRAAAALERGVATSTHAGPTRPSPAPAASSPGLGRTVAGTALGVGLAAIAVRVVRRTIRRRLG